MSYCAGHSCFRYPTTYRLPDRTTRPYQSPCNRLSYHLRPELCHLAVKSLCDLDGEWSCFLLKSKHRCLSRTTPHWRNPYRHYRDRRQPKSFRWAAESLCDSRGKWSCFPYLSTYQVTAPSPRGEPFR